MLYDINPWAVLVAALSAFALGGLWYSPLLFGKRWQHEEGLSDAECKAGHKGITYLMAFLLSLLSAGVLALLIGPKQPLICAVSFSFILGTGCVAAAFGLNYLFARRSMALFLIDGGYHITQFTLYGLILGLWH